MYTYLLADVSACWRMPSVCAPGIHFVRRPDRAARGPGWVVNSIQTEYQPDGMIAPAAGQFAMPSQDPFMDKPRIEVTMQVTTWMPQDQRFVVATLPRWIEDNAARAGLPYQLVPQGATERKVVAARPGVGIPLAVTPDEQVVGAPDFGPARPRAGRPVYNLENPTQEQMAAINQGRIDRGEVMVAGGVQGTALQPGSRFGGPRRHRPDRPAQTQ